MKTMPINEIKNSAYTWAWAMLGGFGTFLNVSPSANELFLIGAIKLAFGVVGAIVFAVVGEMAKTWYAESKLKKWLTKK
jgi:hypothetical protein